MQLLIEPAGNCRCIYGEDIDLSQLGRLSIQRGSHVEPTEDGRWTADLSPVNGPTLGPFVTRTKALQAEHDWLPGKLEYQGHRQPFLPEAKERSQNILAPP